MKNWDLKNKRALVTGGSKGIGKAIVAEFIALGAEVLFTGRNETDLFNTEQEFKQEGARVTALSGDVADAAAQARIAEWISQNWGSLDILVNNAGVNIRRPSHEYIVEEYNKVIGINMLAPFELCRLLLPMLQKGNKPSVVSIASVAGSYDVQTGAPYGLAKAGMIQMGRNLASEWAKFDIRVNTVSPWFTYTPLTKGLLSNTEKLDSIIARTPLKRIANDSEVAAAVAFLAMDKASYITGQNLAVDGGITAGLL
ncbi:SDR family oxidoreductase [Mucilaginibacter celer]|uniref:SDR family oxidoreductase n=1 Tax=Mucilaginibacter celer TaxID=2305508 RepID=A0A494W5L2_9SPHI|nr:SDR family oxidoreductase [Mucilaginibacter celer]AYL98848.1 SDR family oxidoreductase [Mucilaginibacter celer]